MAMRKHTKTRFSARMVPGATPAAEMPGFIKPQLATLKLKAPAGDRWVHEIKYGYGLPSNTRPRRLDSPHYHQSSEPGSRLRQHHRRALYFLLGPPPAPGRLKSGSGLGAGNRNVDSGSI
jgi:hypothetical protein